MTEFKLTPTRRSRSTCPVCRDHVDGDAGEDTRSCARCGIVVHGECWIMGGGCPTIGCPQFKTVIIERQAESQNREFVRGVLVLFGVLLSITALVCFFLSILASR
jgi:hypothetical protein